MNKRSKTQRLLPNRTLRSLLLIIAIMSTLTSYAVKDYDFYIGGIYYKKIRKGLNPLLNPFLNLETDLERDLVPF